MKITILLSLLTISLSSFSNHEPSTENKKRVRITIDMTKAKIGKTLEYVDILGGGTEAELQFFASCIAGFRSAIKNTEYTDYTFGAYKEFYLSDNYELNPSDDDVTIDVETAVKAYDKPDLINYKQELKKCVEALLIVGTVKTDRY